MLTLLLGTDWVANRDQILESLAQDVKKKRGGRILMVPELISHDTERRLCMAAGDTSSRYAEVLSFTRLASRVADSVGAAAQSCLDSGGRVVAMAAAARQLHSRLKAYAAVETRPEFLTELVDAVDEFKRCCIGSQDLLEASRQTQGSLAQKLEELSLLLEAYDSLCARGKRDPRDQMTWLLEQLEEGTFGEDHVFYIDGFPDFTRQHLAILEHLIRVSPNVTVSLNCDRMDSRNLSFEKAGSTAAELVRCAKRTGVEVRLRYVQPTAPELEPVRAGLFQGSIRQTPELKGRLSLYRQESPYLECCQAAERILELVRQGCRYRDMGVVCTDMACYQRDISLVFRGCGIPVYQSGTEDILQRSVVITVLSALDAALGGLEQREVLRYLKSVLSPLEPDICDQVENYVILWGISGLRWLQEWQNHPEGLGQDWTEEAKTRLAVLNDARALALTPLEHLRDGFRYALTLSDQVEALYAFLEEIRLAQRLDELAAEMESAGNHRDAQILNQLWEILMGALEQLYDVLGDTVWDGETFTRLFTLLLSQYDVGTIPPVLDAVMVGPVSAMRCQQVKHLFVLGALEGNLPGYGGSRGVLTDQERVALRELGVPLTGGAMEGLQAEFAEIYGVFCGARETVTLSCPAGQPSFVYRRLSDLAGGENTPRQPLGAAQTDKSEAAAFLAQWDSAEAAAGLGIGEEYGFACRRRDYGLGSVTWEHIEKLYGKKLNLSASQVDKQAECRLSYFLRYGLGARERKEITVDPAEFGTYVHAVLEHTARQVMEQGGFQAVTLEQMLELARNYSKEYAEARFSQLDSQRAQYLFQRNIQELEMVLQELWRELREAEFAPVDFELAFGDGGKMPAIQIPGHQMEAQLRGFVDRVDSWQGNGANFFRVVDYKTGKKDFDYCDVFNGIGLQMLLYLFALEQGGQGVLGSGPIPAGVQYFPARAPMLAAAGPLSDEEASRKRQKEWERKGLLLRNSDVLKAMDPGKSTLTDELADGSQFRLLKNYLFRVLGNMVDDIASGNVSPNPYTRGTAHNACAFCPYGGVCHKGEVEGRRNYKAMNARRFWEEIGKEMVRNG